MTAVTRPSSRTHAILRRITHAGAGRAQLLIMGILAVIGAAACLYATQIGPGLQSDSVAYLGGARSLLEKRGYVLALPRGVVQPITDWPPLYSLALAGLGVLGIDLQQGARWLGAVLFGVTVFLGALTIRHLTGGSARATLFGAFLMFASVDLLQVYSEVQSEPLFISLGVLCLILLGRHLERPGPLYLIGAAIAAGLACATRYAGVVLLATGAVALMLGRRAWRQRLLDTLTFAGLGCLPLAAFVVRNRLVSANALGSSRSLAFHAVPLAKLQLGLDTMWGWLAPDRSVPGSLARLVGQVPGFRWIGLALAGLALAVVVLQARRRPRISGYMGALAGALPPFGPVWLAIIFPFLYIPFVLFSISFIDLETGVDARIASPAFLAILIALMVLANRLLVATRPSHFAVAAAWFGGVLVGTSYAHAAVFWVRSTHHDGLDYGSRTWLESDVLRKVRALSSGVPIYSNDAEVVTLVTGRPAFDLPEKIDVGTGRPNPNYQSDLAAVRDQLRAGAVLVYLQRVPWREPWYGSEAELVSQLQLHLLMKASDGSIFDSTVQGRCSHLVNEVCSMEEESG